VKTIINDIIQRLSGIYSSGEACELAYWILEETTGKTRTQLLSGNITFTPQYDDILQRLLRKEPIQYIFGHTEWCGLDLKVTPATLIPRPETAELVESLLTFSPSRPLDPTTHYPLPTTPKILDIGTGSGCIAIALKKQHPDWEVWAMDISAEALAVAQENAKRCGVKIHFFQADIFTDEIGSFDLIVSNPPYVMESEKTDMDSNVLDYEPHTALFVPNEDPLRFYRQIAMLKKARYVAFEINQQLGKEMVTLMDSLGYTDIELKKDSYGNERILLARLDK